MSITSMPGRAQAQQGPSKQDMVVARFKETMDQLMANNQRREDIARQREQFGAQMKANESQFSRGQQLTRDEGLATRTSAEGMNAANNVESGRQADQIHLESMRQSDLANLNDTIEAVGGIVEIGGVLWKGGQTYKDTQSSDPRVKAQAIQAYKSATLLVGQRAKLMFPDDPGFKDAYLEMFANSASPAMMTNYLVNEAEIMGQVSNRSSGGGGTGTTPTAPVTQTVQNEGASPYGTNLAGPQPDLGQYAMGNLQQTGGYPQIPADSIPVSAPKGEQPIAASTQGGQSVAPYTAPLAQSAPQIIQSAGTPSDVGANSNLWMGAASDPNAAVKFGQEQKGIANDFNTNQSQTRRQAEGHYTAEELISLNDDELLNVSRTVLGQNDLNNETYYPAIEAEVRRRGLSGEGDPNIRSPYDEDASETPMNPAYTPEGRKKFNSGEGFGTTGGPGTASFEEVQSWGKAITGMSNQSGKAGKTPPRKVIAVKEGVDILTEAAGDPNGGSEMCATMSDAGKVAALEAVAETGSSYLTQRGNDFAEQTVRYMNGTPAQQAIAFERLPNGMEFMLKEEEYRSNAEYRNALGELARAQGKQVEYANNLAENAVSDPNAAFIKMTMEAGNKQILELLGQKLSDVELTKALNLLPQAQFALAITTSFFDPSGTPQMTEVMKGFPFLKKSIGANFNFTADGLQKALTMLAQGGYNISGGQQGNSQGSANDFPQPGSGNAEYTTSSYIDGVR